MGWRNMDWGSVGARIRKQREFLGYTREQFSELLDVTSKFCSDIELGIKGMSVPTLCRISHILKLPTDYILFGEEGISTDTSPAALMLRQCPSDKLPYLESVIKSFLLAMDEKKE